MSLFSMKKELAMVVAQAHQNKQTMDQSLQRSRSKIHNTITSKTALGGAFVTGVMAAIFSTKTKRTTQIKASVDVTDGSADKDADVHIDIEQEKQTKKSGILANISNQLIMVATSILTAKLTGYMVSAAQGMAAKEEPDNKETIE